MGKHIKKMSYQIQQIVFIIVTVHCINLISLTSLNNQIGKTPNIMIVSSCPNSFKSDQSSKWIFYFRYLELVHPIWHKTHFKIRWIYLNLFANVALSISFHAAYLIPTSKVIMFTLIFHFVTLFINNMTITLQLVLNLSPSIINRLLDEK